MKNLLITKFNNDYIIRSRTGKYHIGSINSSVCNGRSGRFNRADVELVTTAQESSFCKKCFWEGKKSALQIINS
jgi:hypothetical protein